MGWPSFGGRAFDVADLGFGGRGNGRMADMADGRLAFGLWL
jgi:hypothetical protein